MSNVSVREAAILTNKSRETINKATKDGTLSYTHNAQNHKVIHISELERVYPLVVPIEKLADAKVVSSRPTASEPDCQDWRDRYTDMKVQFQVLEREISALRAERERERDQLQSQIDNLQKSLDAAQAGQNRVTLLLENYSKVDLYKAAYRKLKLENAAKQTAAPEQSTSTVAQPIRTIWQRFTGS